MNPSRSMLFLVIRLLFLTVIRKIPGSTNMNLSISFSQYLHGYKCFLFPIILGVVDFIVLLFFFERKTKEEEIEKYS